MPLYDKPPKLRYLLPILGKSFAAFTLCWLIFFSLAGECCENHDPQHQITCGNPQATLAVTQHFSLGSPEFIRFVTEEFPSFKADFIDTGAISWTFCPRAIDLKTVQLLACLKVLPEEQKTSFFEQLLRELNPRTIEESSQAFLRILEILTLPVYEIAHLQSLKVKELFTDVGEFLDQPVFTTSLSNIEIGEEAFPYLIHPVAIRYQIEQRLK